MEALGLSLISTVGSYAIFHNSQLSQSGGGDSPETLYVFFGHGFESTLPAIDLTINHQDLKIIMLATEGCTLIDAHEEYEPNRLNKMMTRPQEIDLFLQDLHGVDRANTFALYQATRAPNLVLSTCRRAFELTGLYKLKTGEIPERINLKNEFFKLQDLIKLLEALEKGSNFVLDLYCCRETLTKLAETHYCYPVFQDYLGLGKIPIVEPKDLVNYPAQSLSDWYEKIYDKTIKKVLEKPKDEPNSEQPRLEQSHKEQVSQIYGKIKSRGYKGFLSRSKISGLLQEGLSEDRIISEILGQTYN